MQLDWIKNYQLPKGFLTYASSSCFILVNSSRVIVPSPSPSFCNFSREASKSGLGGQGGIWKIKKRCNDETKHFWVVNVAESASFRPKQNRIQCFDKNNAKYER